MNVYEQDLRTQQENKKKKDDMLEKGLLLGGAILGGIALYNAATHNNVNKTTLDSLFANKLSPIPDNGGAAIVPPTEPVVEQIDTASPPKHLFTSYYANAKNIPEDYNKYIISKGVPTEGNGFKTDIQEIFRPSNQLLSDYKQGIITDTQYTEQYMDYLNKNKDYIMKTLNDLPDKSVLFCYEGPDKFCHRHLVADFATKNGLSISEYETEKLLNDLAKPDAGTQQFKVISGGQTGADILGVKLAKEYGFATGGTVNIDEQGRIITEVNNYGQNNPQWDDGIDREQFGFTKIQKSSKYPDYPSRTRENVLNSDGTVYFATDEDGRGLRVTQKFAQELNKPFLLNPKTAEEIAKFREDNKIWTMNVAGNRGSNFNSIKETTENTLKGFYDYMKTGKFPDKGTEQMNIVTNNLDGIDIDLDNINKPLGFARYNNNGYEVSSAGDARFSAMNAKFKEGTNIFGHDVSGRTIESVYQNGIKQGDWITDSNTKTGKPMSKDIIKGDTSNASYIEGYLPLWKEWAKQNPELIEDLYNKANGKVLTDKFASTDVSQARALSEILRNRYPNIVDGNIVVSAKEPYVLQQVNNKGVMGAGLAKSIKWDLTDFDKYSKGDLSLGNVIDIPSKMRANRTYMNLVGQDGYGTDKRYTNYKALSDAFDKLITMIPSGESIAIPYGMGAGLGGGDWNVIDALIKQKLYPRYNITYYKYK